MLKIKNWQSRFENNRSKQVESARWFPMPNALDTEAQCTILSHKRGAEIFTAWTLILQLASRCKVRGELTREDGTPLSIEAIAMMTRARGEWLEIAIPMLLQVGEIELLANETSGERQANVTTASGECQLPALNGRNRMEVNGSEKKERGAAVKISPLALVEFDRFWSIYPNRTAKQKALESWISSGATFEICEPTIKAWAESEQWTKDAGKWIPMPSTWLNQKRWTDEPPPNPKKQALDLHMAPGKWGA